MTEKELRENFVSKAISFVGSNEGSYKHKYIIDTYNKIVPLPVNYKVKYTDSWCATFVSFVAKECGLLDIIPAECGCGRQIALAKKMGIFIENDSYVPKTGDIIFYDWADDGVGDNTGVPDHVGIVVTVSGSNIKIIEGNIKNSVGYRNIAVNGRYIRGFICPNFASKATKTTGSSSGGSSSKGSVCRVELPILTKGDTGKTVKALQILLIGHGHSCGLHKADGSFGPATLKAVHAFQKAKGLVVDGSVGPATWNKLLGK